MDTPMLRLLGRPDLRAGGPRELLEPGQVLQFLAVLAHRGDWVRRDELIGLFWAEGTDAAGRRNLRRLLFRARERLAAVRDPSLPSIGAEGDALRWRVVTDVQAWRRALDQERFDTAFRLWRGPFCDGIDVRGDGGIGGWLAVEREHLSSAWKGAVLPHAARIASERPGEAAALLAKLAGIDPLDEDVVQAQLRTLVSAGQMYEAERVFHAFARRLDAELALEPSSDTAAIALRALEASPHLAADIAVGASATDASEAAVVKRMRSRMLFLPFVGRQDIQAELAARLESAQVDGGGAVVIEGEAGVGKTRLADEFLAEVTAKGVPVFRGRAFERELGAPLEPVREALASLTPPEFFAARDDKKFWPPERPAMADVHQALTGQLVRLARARGAAVLFVDDVQWADSATLEFLAYAAKRTSVEPVLILMGLRREDRTSLERWLADLSQHRALDTLRLERLSQADLRSLLTKIASVQSREVAWLAEHIYQQTEGNPFYATEYLRWLSVAGGVQLSPGGRIVELHSTRIEAAELPENVLSLILARYLGFPEPTRKLLDLAAVLGRAFDLSLLEAVAETSGEAFWSSFAPLATSGVMVEVGGSTYAFSHDKLRQTIYLRLGPPVRRELHGRVAAALARDGADPSELAHHHLRAENWAEAFAQLMAAGIQAEKRDAWQAAVEVFRRAEQIAESLPDPARKQLDALEKCERILELMDRRAERAAAVERMITLAQRVEDPVSEAHAYLRKMALRALAGDHDGVRAARRRATRLMEQVGDPLGEARVYRELAYAAFSLGDERAVVDAGLGAIRVYRAAGDARYEAATAWNVAMAYRRMDRVEDALEWGDRAADIYDAMGKGTGEYMRYEMQAWAKRRSGQLEEAVRLLETTLSLAEELGEPHLILEKHMNLGSALLEVGRARAAMAQFVAGAAIGLTLGDPRHEGYPMLQTGAVKQGLGDLDGAIEAFRGASRLLGAAYALTGVPTERLAQADALSLLGSVLGEWGRAQPPGTGGLAGGSSRVRPGESERDPAAAEALAALGQALDIVQELQDPLRASKILMERGVQHWRAGRFSLAAEDFAAAATAAGKAGGVSREIAARASHMVALLDGARVQEAIAVGEQALEQLCAFPDRAAEAHVCRALARAWSAAGNPVRARALRMRSTWLARTGVESRRDQTPYRGAGGGHKPPKGR